MRTVAVTLLLVLAACGGGADEPEATSSTPSPSVTATAAPTLTPPTGTPAPEALSRFRCEQDAEGAWNASGYVANASKTAVTYQVTVYIGEATGGQERAKTKQLASVAGEGSVPFRINKIPAPEDGGPCHVQVLATA